MRRLPTLLMAFSLGLCCLAAIPAAAAPREGRLILAAYSGNYFDHYSERTYKACRRKVRRELGPARGRHVRALRLAFIQTCTINGGSHW